MTSNLTRFYLESLGEGTMKFNTVVEDVETIDADEFEAKLKEQNIDYIRIDL